MSCHASYLEVALQGSLCHDCRAEALGRECRDRLGWPWLSWWGSWVRLLPSSCSEA